MIARLARNRRPNAADNLQRKINRYLSGWANQRAGDAPGLLLLFLWPGGLSVTLFKPAFPYYSDEPARLADQGRLQELEDHYRAASPQGEFLPDLRPQCLMNRSCWQVFPGRSSPYPSFPGQFSFPGSSIAWR